jgi:hypothetical protein
MYIETENIPLWSLLIYQKTSEIHPNHIQSCIAYRDPALDRCGYKCRNDGIAMTREYLTKSLHGLIDTGTLTNLDHIN